MDADEKVALEIEVRQCHFDKLPKKIFDVAPQNSVARAVIRNFPPASNDIPKPLILQRFVYRQLMYYVILKSIVSAIRGGNVGWGKLERTGKAKVGA